MWESFGLVRSVLALQAIEGDFGFYVKNPNGIDGHRNNHINYTSGSHWSDIYMH